MELWASSNLDQEGGREGYESLRFERLQKRGGKQTVGVVE